MQIGTKRIPLTPSPSKKLTSQSSNNVPDGNSNKQQKQQQQQHVNETTQLFISAKEININMKSRNIKFLPEIISSHKMQSHPITFLVYTMCG